MTGNPSGNMLDVSVVYDNPFSGRRPDNVSNQKIVDYQGKKVTGEVVDFESSPENFNNYLLTDGTNIKIKTVLLEVIRLVGEYGPSGDPIYLFTAQQIINTNSPEGLKQKKQLGYLYD
jgi:hypothetical protein